MDGFEEYRVRPDLLPFDDASEWFKHVYLNNVWRGSESRSGSGSTMEGTLNLRSCLPEMIKKYQINSMLDAGCGDFYWMNYLLPHLSIEYIGCDIVFDMVHDNRMRYGETGARFVRLDITRDPLPVVDLMLCRDCLFHMSFADVKRSIVNFLLSGIPYLLTTTFPDAKNVDIKTGDFWFINLCAEPWNFPEPLHRIVDDENNKKRDICLWSAEQIRSIVCLS
jgi:SAM-dependent methyltransferase